jgi:hypothetical protein
MPPCRGDGSGGGHACERLDVTDEVRDAKRVARRELRRGGSRRKADLARVLVAVLVNERGPQRKNHFVPLA